MHDHDHAHEAAGRRRRHWASGIGLTMALALALSAPAMAEELVIAIPDEFPTLAAPWGYQAQTALVLRNVHEPLLDRDPATGNLIPGLATNWEQIDDTTWRFHLREGVTFHDGSPFNAEAAAFSINDTYSAENRNDPVYAPISTRAAIPFEAVVVDDYTIDIVSEQLKPLLLGHIFTAGISSMEQLTERPETFGDTPIGTGAWKFVSWDRGAGYTLERNPDWWGLDSEDIEHTPDFDRVQFLIRPEVSSRIAAVRAGEADFAWDLPAEECASQLGDNCVEGPSPIVSYVRIDTPHPTLGDPRIREALAISIDRDGIGQALLGGAPPASQLDVMGALGFIEDLEPFPYDPDRARELIQEAEADGVDTSLTVSLLGRRASFAGDELVLEVLQAGWTDLGFDISADMMESAAYNAIFVGGSDTYEEGRAALFLLRWPNDLFDAGRTVQSHLFCPGGVNIECQPELEARAREAMSLPDAEREVAMQELLRDFNKDMNHLMFIPLNELRIFHGVGDRVDWAPRQDMWLYAREFQRR